MRAHSFSSSSQILEVAFSYHAIPLPTPLVATATANSLPPDTGTEPILPGFPRLPLFDKHTTCYHHYATTNHQQAATTSASSSSSACPSSTSPCVSDSFSGASVSNPSSFPCLSLTLGLPISSDEIGPVFSVTRRSSHRKITCSSTPDVFGALSAGQLFIGRYRILDVYLPRGRPPGRSSGRPSFVEPTADRPTAPLHALARASIERCSRVGFPVERATECSSRRDSYFTSDTATSSEGPHGGGSTSSSGISTASRQRDRRTRRRTRRGADAPPRSPPLQRTSARILCKVEDCADGGQLALKLRMLHSHHLLASCTIGGPMRQAREGENRTRLDASFWPQIMNLSSQNKM